MEIVYSTNETQDAKNKIDRIWKYDPLEGFRLMEQTQVSNVEGVYECRAEKRLAGTTETVTNMSVPFKIMRPIPAGKKNN